MTLSYEFLQARAEEAAREAETAVLQNVRDRALRSAAAWRQMAALALKTLRERDRVRESREAI